MIGIINSCADTLKTYKLITPSKKFRLVEREAVMIVERANAIQGEGWKTFRIAEWAFDIFKAESDRSGIPVYLIVDHLLRLYRDLKFLSGDQKGISRLVKAMEENERERFEVQFKKIERIDFQPIEEKRLIPVLDLEPIARDRASPKRKKQTDRIKLNLKNMDARKAFRYALDNYHRWYPTNIDEIRSYLEYVERNMNPVTLEVITKNYHYYTGQALLRNYVEPYEEDSIIPIAKAKECYQLIEKEWNYPDWMMWFDRLVSFWESTHPYRKVKNADLTIGEWFKRYGLEVPDVLEEIKNNVITTYTELKRTGIISDLDLEIKKHLGIEDLIENALKDFDDLNSYEKAEISSLVYSSDGYNHPYAQLLRERLERDKLKNGEKDPDLT